MDAYGVEVETRIVHVGYYRAAIDRINWTNFLTDNVYVIASFVNNHPLFPP